MLKNIGGGHLPLLAPLCYSYAINITLFWVMTPCILVEW